MTDLEALNREVAERVMGWVPPSMDGENWRHKYNRETGCHDLWNDATGETLTTYQYCRRVFWSLPDDSWQEKPPKFSTDIAAAFEVVEKVLADKPTWRFKLQSRPGMWLACFSHWVADESLKCEATGTKAEAICRAALQVVGAETP